MQRLKNPHPYTCICIFIWTWHHPMGFYCCSVFSPGADVSWIFNYVSLWLQTESMCFSFLLSYVKDQLDVHFFLSDNDLDQYINNVVIVSMCFSKPCKRCPSSLHIKFSHTFLFPPLQNICIQVAFLLYIRWCCLQWCRVLQIMPPYYFQ